MFVTSFTRNTHHNQKLPRSFLRYGYNMTHMTTDGYQTSTPTVLLAIRLHNLHGFSGLTLNVRGPIYLGLTRWISWLLMPWLLTSPGHQQPWYWLDRICRPSSYLRKDFKYLCQINVEEWHKMQIYVYIPCEKFSMLRVQCKWTVNYMWMEIVYVAIM